MPARPRRRLDLGDPLPPRLSDTEVFAARHLVLARDVEVRLVAPGSDPAARFLPEMAELAALDQPGFPEVLDRGRVDGRAFYAVAPPRGQALSTRPGPPDAVRVLRQLASAIAAAHAHGVQPSAPDPALVRWDPGDRRLRFVHHRRPADAPPPAYLRGVPEEQAAATSPIAAVLHWACLATWLLDGEPAFDADGTRRAGAPALATLAPDLRAILRSCLDLDPDARPGVMTEVDALLRQYPADLVDSASAAPALRTADDVLTSVRDLRAAGVVPEALPEPALDRAGLEAPVRPWMDRLEGLLEGPAAQVAVAVLALLLVLGPRLFGGG